MDRLAILEQFFREVAHMTVFHRGIEGRDGELYASVAPSDLDRALVKVDPEWYLLKGTGE